MTDNSQVVNYMLTRLKLLTALAIGRQEWCYPFATDDIH